MSNNLIPNSTQIPNIISDFIKPRIPEAECRCIDYICRRTFGFRKERDRISLSQFVDGIKDKSGKRFDYGAGLARASVVEGLRNLIGSGLVEVIKTKGGNYYQINLNLFLDKDAEKVADEAVQKVNRFRQKTKSELKNKPKQRKLLIVDKVVDKGVVQKVNRFSKRTGSSSATEPISVQLLNPQNKGNKEKQSNSFANNKNSGMIGDILKDRVKSIKPVNTQRWQELALEIIGKIPDAKDKKSSVFKCCRDNEQKAKIAFEDCKELDKLYVKYFFKVYNELCNLGGN